jgi:hypothetical protein
MFCGWVEATVIISQQTKSGLRQRCIGGSHRRSRTELPDECMQEPVSIT